MDFGPSATDYAKHRQTFPDSFFERLPLQGDLLDLGSGTGSLARGYAKQGPRVVATDISHPMLQQAADLPRRVVARAEAIPFRDGSFDAVTAGQCWHWFDGPVAARECARVLRPRGRLVIAHFNYLPLPGSVAELSEALILARNPGWAMAGLHRMNGLWDTHLLEAGFVELDTWAYEIELTYTHDAWRGRMRACNGVLALGPEAIAEYDQAHSHALAQFFPGQLTVRHEVFALTARRG
ncbi:MAG: class I SAM-dependent methyltransferase [Myxococcaceae bacterium]|nr:class I SAM-dependent methyltransferase [Myxococcaceae bacterium]